MAVVTCESGKSAGFTNLQVPMTISNTATDAFTLFDPLIQINWQSTDLLSTSARTTTSTGSPTTTTTSAFIPTESADLSSTSNSSSSATTSELSTGAKAGIGIGASLVVIALAILLLLFIRKPKSKYSIAGQYSPTGLHELIGGDKNSAMDCSHPVSEMEMYDGPPPAEMNGRRDGPPPAEIDDRYGRPPPVEMDGA